MKIFIAEDEPAMRAELAALLARNGYTSITPETFEELPDQILNSGADLVLLDLGLPVLDGLTVLRNVRTSSDIPILILTSRESDADELMGMHFGADDYVTKPFNPQILLARIESIVRRTSRGEVSSLMKSGNLALDLARGSVTGPAGTVSLTKNEQGILAALLRRPGEIVSRDEIMEQLWQSDAFVDDNTLTVNMTRLRAKLREAGCGSCIKTRRGQGYQM